MHELGGEEPVICMRALKSVWGNPTSENFKIIPQIAGLSVTRKAGTYLKDLSNKGTVKVLMKARATRQWDKLVQPMTWLKGNGRTNKPEVDIEQLSSGFFSRLK